MKTLIVIFLCLRIFLADGQALDSTLQRKVDSLIALSRQRTGERNFEEAMQVAELAQQQAEVAFGKESAAHASCLFNLGRVFYFAGRYAEAEPFYLEARDIRGRVLGKEHADYTASLNNLGGLYLQMARYPEAERPYIEAKDIRGRMLGKQHRDYANSLHNLGTLYIEMGRYQEAEPLYIESKAIWEKISGKESPEYGRSLNALATLYSDLGRFDTAEPLHIEAIAIVEKNLGREQPEYAASLVNLANLYIKMGRYEAAEPLFIWAKTMQEKMLGKEHPEYARSLNSLASLYYNMGRYEDAEPLFIEANTIQEKRQGKEHPEYGQSLNNLGNLYFQMGCYEEVEPLFIEAKAIREKVLGKAHPEYAQSLHHLADLYNLMGRYEAAESLFLEAKALAANGLGKEHPDYARLLNDLGYLYSRMGRYASAESLFLEAKALWENVLGKEHPDYARLLCNLADLYTCKEQYKSAEPLYAEAKAIWSKVLGMENQENTTILLNFACLYHKMGRNESAGPLYQEAQAINQTLLSNSARFLSERELVAYVRLFTNNLDHYYSFATQTNGVFPGFSAGCYDNALFHKGFLLNVSSRISRLADSDTTATRLTNLLRAFHRRLADEYVKPIAARKNVGEMEEKANATEKLLARTVADFGEAVQEVRWQEVQAALKQGEAAIEFIHFRYCTPNATDSVLYAALVLHPGDVNPSMVPLFEARQLASLLPQSNDPDLIDDFYNGKNGSATYALIWQPLEKLLEGVTTVYYSPSGLLHRLNLGAVPLNMDQVIADRYQLVLLGSTRQLVGRNGSSSNSNTAVLFGGIQYDSDLTSGMPALPDMNRGLEQNTAIMIPGFPALVATSTGGPKPWKFLPATATEVNKIGAMLSKNGFSTQFWIGSLASEEVFKQLGRSEPAPRILHLATHGYFFPDTKTSQKQNPISMGEQDLIFRASDNPMIRSGLILAGANQTWASCQAPAHGEDGILTAYEISQQNLSNTEIVVLSACETGLGQIQGNEGVYGLQRAFKIAGARYLIMSLWQVSDQQTGELMIEFYRHYLNQHLSVPEAFRLAQQDLRGKYPGSPYVWAGFVLIE